MSRAPMGMGALYRRSPGGCYWFSFDGRKVRTPYKDRESAEKWRRNYLADAANASRQVGRENATVADLLALVERDYQRTGKASSAALSSRLKRLREYFGALRLTDVRDAHIEGYVDERLREGRQLKSGARKPVAAATVNRELEILRRAFVLGSRQTPPLIAHVPLIAMLDESDNVRTQIIDHATYRRLIDALPDAERWLTVLAYHIGWRFERLRTLTWDQVDFERAVILAPDKQRAGKMVGTAPIYGGMREVLLEAWRSAEELWHTNAQSATPAAIAAETSTISSCPARDTSPTAAIASGTTGAKTKTKTKTISSSISIATKIGTATAERPAQKSVSSSAHTGDIPVIHRPSGAPVVDIRKAWARCTKAAGCPRLRFHDLRACAASNLIEAGVPQIEAQKIIGHKTAAMFQRYHIVSTDRLAEIGRMVEARREEASEGRTIQ